MGGHHDKEQKLISMMEHQKQNKLKDREIDRAWTKVVQYTARQPKGQAFPHFLQYLWEHKSDYNLDEPIIVDDSRLIATQVPPKKERRRFSLRQSSGLF